MLLAAAGVAVGHVLGYAAAHPRDVVAHLSLGSHGYLPGAMAIVVPLGIAAGLVHAVRTARLLGVGGAISVRGLAATQLALFGVQEVVERAATGMSPAGVLASLAAEPGVWLGLVAQLLVAWMLVGAVGVTRRIVARAIGRRRLAAARASLAPPAPVQPTVRSRPAVGAVGVRGPPLVAG